MCFRQNLNELSDVWQQILAPLLALPTSHQLESFLRHEIATGHTVYPSEENYFAALRATPWEKVKGIIIGQDPYHQPGQAHGLAFSVASDQKIPPSLANIFHELAHDLQCEPPQQGNLTHWAEQGILLLNTILTVREGEPLSHINQGWEEITDGILRALCQQKEHLAIFAWGKHAQQKIASCNTADHCVLQAPHPSPLSSYRGFFGCRHFSQANAYWQTHGMGEIFWC